MVVDRWWWHPVSAVRQTVAFVIAVLGVCAWIKQQGESD